MKSELHLARSNRKVEINIVGGDDDSIFISVPKRKNELIYFLPGEQVKLNFYYRNEVFNFDTSFKEIHEFNQKYYYKLVIQELFISPNFRKEYRQNVEISCMVFSHSDNYFSTILDINDSGMKIETNIPINGDHIVIFYNDKNENWIRGNIVWSKKEGALFHYGLKIDD